MSDAAASARAGHAASGRSPRGARLCAADVASVVTAGTRYRRSVDAAALEPPEASDEVAREENVKHLEWILGIVTRMGNNSMLIKGWSLTVAAASYGFSVNRLDWRLTLIGMITVLGFWSLDTYFLRQERLFRLLYDYVRSDTRAVPRFSMSVHRFLDREAVQYLTVARSQTLLVFYGILLVAGLVAWLVPVFIRV